jgi:hypothetical protein
MLVLSLPGRFLSGPFPALTPPELVNINPMEGGHPDEQRRKD